MKKNFKDFCDDTYNDIFFRDHNSMQYDWEEEASKRMVSLFNVKSILDLGCGVGRWLKASKELGVLDVYGIEFCFEKAVPFICEEIKESIHFGDVSIPFSLDRTFDVILSIEVAEHIFPENSEHFVENICKHCSNLIVLTAAPPGQGGLGHINTQPKPFWISLFEKNHFLLNHPMIYSLLNCWADIVPSYIKNNLMIFTRME